MDSCNFRAPIQISVRVRMWDETVLLTLAGYFLSPSGGATSVMNKT